MATTKRPAAGGPARPGKKSSAASSDASKRPRLRSSHGAPPPPKKTSAAASKAPAKAKAAPGARGAGPASRREPPKVKRERAPRPSLVPGATSQASDQARELAVLVAISALEKKASNLEVIDVAGRVDYADFLVLMSGRSDRHVAALSQAIEATLGKRGHKALSVEGLPHATWVLMDYGDVVVHAFQEEARSLYDVDGLWTDARRLPLPADGPRDDV